MMLVGVPGLGYERRETFVMACLAGFQGVVIPVQWLLGSVK